LRAHHGEAHRRGLGNQRAETSLVGFGKGELSLSSYPVSAPATDGRGRAGEVERNLLVGQASGSRSGL
jgi:hypothetical protein